MDSYHRDSQIVYPIGPASGSIARNFMSNVFMWMFAGLGLSAFTAFMFASDPSLLSMLWSKTGGYTGLGMITAFAPLAIVLVINFGLNRLSATATTVMFLVYAALMGVSLSFLGLRYTHTSIFASFISAAGMFGVMAFMGYTTKQDLTSFGRILRMALIGLVIAVIVNIFLHSGIMGYVISLIGVMVFTGLTAYDVQKLKMIGAGMEHQGVSATDGRKLSIIGALNLYLDFLNIFLFLLQLFGGRTNDD